MKMKSERFKYENNSVIDEWTEYTYTGNDMRDLCGLLNQIHNTVIETIDNNPNNEETEDMNWDSEETIRWAINVEGFNYVLNRDKHDELNFYYTLFHLINNHLNPIVTSEMRVDTSKINCKKVYNKFLELNKE